MDAVFVFAGKWKDFGLSDLVKIVPDIDKDLIRAAEGTDMMLDSRNDENVLAIYSDSIVL